MAYTLVPTELIVDGAITSAKLDTNIAISGTLGVTGEVTLATHLVMGDNDKIKIGTGGDLEIYHDGSNSYISNSTGNIYLGDTNGAVHIQAKLNEESIICAADGAVSLYHDNAVKLATSSAGVSVTGNATFADNGKAIFGAGSDLEIYHSGSASHIKETGTGNLKLEGTNIELNNGAGNKTYILAVDGGAVQLRYDDATKIATTSTGIDVTGTVVADNAEIGTGGASNANAIVDLTGDTTYTDFGFRILRNSGANGNTDLRHRGTGNLNIEAVEAGNIVFETSDTERMRIDSSGNLGLGTDSPSSYQANADNLVVATTGHTGITIASGTSHLGNIHFADGTSGDDAYRGFIQYEHTANYMRFATNASEAMRIDSSGTIKSSVNGTNANLILDNDADTPYLRFDESSAAKFTIGESSIVGGGSGYYDFYGTTGIGQRFFTNATERMRIDSSGAVLFKSGAFPTNQDSPFIYRIGGGSLAIGAATETGTSAHAAFYTNSLERMRIDSSGNLLINQTSSALTYGKLQVSAGGETAGHGGIVAFFDTDGSVASSNLIQLLSFSGDTDATGGQFIRFRDSNSVMGSVSAASGTTVAYNTSSDRRMKENIVDAASQLEVINDIQIREFDWKNNGHHEVGVIAQELNEVIPNVVQEGGEDVTEEPWGVDYGKLTPYLVKAIQEQQSIIDDLKTRIETLEG